MNLTLLFTGINLAILCLILWFAVRLYRRFWG